MDTRTQGKIMRSANQLVVTLLLATGGPVYAATLTWDGDTDYANGLSTADGNWNGASLWRPASGGANVTWNSAIPDDAVISGNRFATTTITVEAPTTVGTVTFNDNGAGQTFKIAGTYANSLTINTLLAKTNSTGTGLLNLDTVRVIGAGAVLVTNGKLYLGNGTNTFSGGVTVDANGWLQINADSYPTTVGGIIMNGALGTGALTVNGGTVDGKNAKRYVLNAIRINGDFAITTGGTQLYLNGPVDLGEGVRTIAVSATTKDAVLGAVVTNGAIVKTGTGVLSFVGSLSVSNSFTQGVVVQQGTLEIDSDNGGFNALGNRDVSLYEGSTFKPGRYGNEENMLLYHTGSNVPVYLINKYGTTFSGAITETNGPVDLSYSLDVAPQYADTVYTLSGTAANTYSGITRLTNATVNNTTITLALDKTSGVDALAGDVAITGTDAGRPSVVRYNTGKDNQIRDTATVMVGDYGTYRMTDASATPVGRTETVKALVANNRAGSVQFGSTTVGRLSLGVDQGSGIGLFVNSGGTLSGTGQVTVAPAPLAVNAGGTLSPGVNGAGSLQILATAAAATNVDLNDGSTYRWEISDWTGEAGIGYDHVVVTGSVSIAATAGNPMKVAVTGSSLVHFPQAPSTVFTLLTASEGISGLGSDNWAVTVSNIPGLTPENFELRVDAGSGNEQKLMLVYKPTVGMVILMR